MFYYLVAILKSNSPLLIYQSPKPCQSFEIIEVCVRNSTRLAIIIEAVKKPDFSCKTLEKTPLYFTREQIILASFIAQYYCCSYGESFGILTPQNQIPASAPLSPIKPHLLALSDAQQRALDFCLHQNTSLLFGDTGSGKSEIYFHAIAKALEKGFQSLLLMPEIALTPQMEKRLKNAFGSQVGIWHSKITKGKKDALLQALRSGEIQIVAGARSALFLPLERLGLIIMDEEHDDAYKSTTKPRYNARDLCLMLSKKHHIPLILGSATPSVTSYYQAKKEGCLYRLKGRHFQSHKNILFDLPQIPSQRLIDALQKVKDTQSQAIIFVPTRGNFKVLICRKCANSIVCRHCSISLSVHSKQNAMCCHYCGFKQPIPKSCPTCASPDFLSQRLGTQQIKNEISAIFPDLKIGIFDRDHIHTDSQLKSIVKKFYEHKLDVLIGTQMIAKGHDYHNVALSVILDIDEVLKMPDYRCYERAFSLLYQVAGRSGRKNEGSVLIQSLNIPLFQNLIHDYEDFLNFEIKNRQNLYPPFKKLAILHFKNKDALKAKGAMEAILERLKSHLKDDVKPFEIIGAQANAIEKIADTYRYHIFLRISQQVPTLKILRHLYTHYPIFEIDIDPVDFS